MPVVNLSPSMIARRFDKAAQSYDEFASIQAEVAQCLVDWAMLRVSPVDVLDLGSGTGLVAEAMARRWPRAAVTALDHAPAMLHRAQRKISGLNVIAGDASRIDLARRYDAIFSSMMLHWLLEPREALRRWQSWLKPEGRLYAALLVEGSFQEWRDLCASEGLKDGLWKMPTPHFADGLAARTERRTLAVAHSSAAEFLYHLKVTGAATPRQEHEPFNVPMMRRLLGRAQKPFVVSYETFYVEVVSSLRV